MLQLANLGLTLLPAGIFEASGCLCLRFGKSYQLEVPHELKPRERDILSTEIVMSQIALQLPPEFRGVYGQAVTLPSAEKGIHDSIN